MNEEIKYCPKCGEKVPLEHKFCPSCGFNFETKNISEEIKKEDTVEAPTESHTVESQTEESHTAGSQEKKSSGKILEVIVGIGVLVFAAFYFFINNGSTIAGSYKYEGYSSEEDIVIEISEENRMAVTFQDHLEGMPYTISVHFNLEPVGEERYIITETDGFYVDIVAEGTMSEVEEFEEEFTDQTFYRRSKAFESVKENEGKSITFSSRRLSVEELDAFELWSIEDFVLTERNGDLFIRNQLLIKQ